MFFLNIKYFVPIQIVPDWSSQIMVIVLCLFVEIPSGNINSKGLNCFDFLSKENKPIILMDGMLILDHNEIINLNTETVKKITVLKENYIYGTENFNGIIDIETFEGDYQNLKNSEYVINIDLLKALTPKKYFNVMYDKKLDRIPDLRRQLFWKPNFELSENVSSIVFYTSDDKGIYEVHLEGFTNNGKPVSIKSFFTVD